MPSGNRLTARAGMPSAETSAPESIAPTPITFRLKRLFRAAEPSSGIADLCGIGDCVAGLWNRAAGLVPREDDRRAEYAEGHLPGPGERKSEEQGNGEFECEVDAQRREGRAEYGTAGEPLRIE